MVSVGVFADNRRRPIHRWYPFVEGYSAELVERALEASPERQVSIFDPFGGSGTTALAASVLGVASSFTEVNPYLAWLAEVKVNQARAGASDAAGLARLAEFASAIRIGDLDEVATGEHPLLVLDEKRRFFPGDVAAKAVGLLDTIDADLDGWARELGRLAVATALIPASNMIRRTDLRRRTRADPPPRALYDLVANKLDEIVEDTKEHNSQVFAETRKLGSDARGPYDSHEAFDLVVTSPPYLNGTNYCRNSKLELLALGFIQTEKDLQALRASSLTAGINNVSARTRPATEIADVEKLARTIDHVAYDQRIGQMIRSYFSDMLSVLATLRAESSDDAQLWLDIGDSRYCGVHVKTHELLEKLAIVAGWRLTATETLRKRRSYDGSPLTQVLLTFAAA